EPLSISQEDVVLRGHAIECRINAEDAARSFAPAPGRIGAYREPAGPGVRVDSGVGPGSEVSPMYDPMVAKLIVWDADREAATRRMVRALSEYEIGELKTLLPFHTAILQTEQWARGETCRDLIEDRAWLKTLAFEKPPAVEAAGAGRLFARGGRGRGGGGGGPIFDRRGRRDDGRAGVHGRGLRQALRRARRRSRVRRRRCQRQR